jgi:hypothetical protein
MLKLAITITLACVSSAALAQTTCQTIGSQTFCNGPNGSNMTGQRIGNFDFYNGTARDPNTGQTRTFNQTCQWIGNMRVCN